MTRKNTSDSREAVPFIFAVPGDFEAAVKQNEKIVKIMQVWGEEVLNFGTDRLKEDMAIPAQLAECKTPQEVMNVYTNFFQTAFRQYTEEASRLGDLYQKIGPDGDGLATMASGKPEMPQ
ncbi:MAG: hypothetical protein CMN55_06865 [Sneathiella sp.]|jgi:hypothetical protein|uniref:phasin family protein n=1 Tax=Sneathiella sp. TaxID=1964365 RepID=UPI000C5A989E|nr:phasin family protein [Sneathiella sp.]MAL78824.1 hypothetical protein [Sneathiella sp.]|tara:strand:- start:199 stop:558 length:360 start_codon:yes stop_codon:yes gene_type:complete